MYEGIQMNNMIKLVILTSVLLHSSTSLANELPSTFLQKELEISFNEYLKGSPESRLYALEAVARLLQLQSENSASFQSDYGPNILPLINVRIGMLHEEQGNQSEANEYFNKAVSTYKADVKDNIDVAKLKGFVKNIDEISSTRFN
jgi:hypothetical protein